MSKVVTNNAISVLYPKKNGVAKNSSKNKIFAKIFLDKSGIFCMIGAISISPVPVPVSVYCRYCHHAKCISHIAVMQHP